VSGTRAGVPRRVRGARWWLTLTVEIATVVGVLFAAATFLLDHTLFGGSGVAGSTTSSPDVIAPTAGAGGGPTPASGPSSASPVRYLTDLEPDSGGGFVQRIGSHSLRMACGSGDSDDRQREVSYIVPPALTYRSFTSGVSAAGLRDTRIKAVLLVDQQEIAAPVVTTGSSAQLTWSGARAGQVTLRIICDPGATAATFTEPGLSG